MSVNLAPAQKSSPGLQRDDLYDQLFFKLQSSGLDGVAEPTRKFTIADLRIQTKEKVIVAFALNLIQYDYLVNYLGLDPNTDGCDLTALRESHSKGAAVRLHYPHSCSLFPQHCQQPKHQYHRDRPRPRGDGENLSYGEPVLPVPPGRQARDAVRLQAGNILAFTQQPDQRGKRRARTLPDAATPSTTCICPSGRSGTTRTC